MHTYTVYAAKINGVNQTLVNNAPIVEKGPITAVKKMLSGRAEGFRLVTQRDVFGKYWAGNNIRRDLREVSTPRVNTWIQLVDENGKHSFVTFRLLRPLYWSLRNGRRVLICPN